MYTSKCKCTNFPRSQINRHSVAPSPVPRKSSTRETHWSDHSVHYTLESCHSEHRSRSTCSKCRRLRIISWPTNNWRRLLVQDPTKVGPLAKGPTAVCFCFVLIWRYDMAMAHLYVNWSKHCEKISFSKLPVGLSAGPGRPHSTTPRYTLCLASSLTSRNLNKSLRIVLITFFPLN